ncbi:MAG: LuxR family transcriptional regulator [Rariglobus sp.]|jgi:DNA-binding CsgD family transcriptional regulator|nr:LuxR family transcriptional regulator [Rariglobus sp.]
MLFAFFAAVSAALTSSEFKRFNAALLTLHGTERPDDFSRQLLAALRELIPADICSVNLLGFFGQPFVHLIDPPGAIPASVEEVLFRTLHENVSYGKRTAATRISDTLSRAQWHRTAHYAEGFRRIGQEDGLGIDLDVGDGCHISLNTSRSTCSFGSTELLALNLLVPHLRSVYHRLTAVHGGEGERGAWALLDPKTLRLRSPVPLGPRLLLEDWFGSSLLPEEARRWIRTSLARRSQVSAPRPLQWQREDRVLRLRLSPSARPDGDHFLLIEEKFSTTLSPRQREILAWVAQGLTNAQIAERIHVGAGTVKRHLEELYVRLNARNRMEAVATGRRRGLLPATPTQPHLSLNK